MINELIELDRLLSGNQAKISDRQAVLFTVSDFKEGISEIDTEKKRGNKTIKINISQQTIQALSDLGFSSKKYYERAKDLTYFVGGSNEDIRSLIRLRQKSQLEPLTPEDHVEIGRLYGFEEDEINYFIDLSEHASSTAVFHYLMV